MVKHYPSTSFLVLSQTYLCTGSLLRPGLGFWELFCVLQYQYAIVVLLLPGKIKCDFGTIVVPCMDLHSIDLQSKFPPPYIWPGSGCPKRQIKVRRSKPVLNCKFSLWLDLFIGKTQGTLKDIVYVGAILA